MADPPSFSVLFGTADHWDPTDPSYADIFTSIGAGSGADKNAVCTSVLNFTNRNPICYAFVLAREEDYVYIGHTPSVCPTDISSTNAYDNLVTLLVGDHADTMVPVVLPNDAFGQSPPPPSALLGRRKTPAGRLPPEELRDLLMTTGTEQSINACRAIASVTEEATSC